MSLDKQCVLVTNATSGAGLACAHRLAGGGAGLVFSGTDDEAVAAAEAELPQHGVPVYGLQADVSRARDVETLLGEAMRVFGHLDAVVVVVPPGPPAPLPEIDDDELERTLAIALRATYLVCQRAARLMAARGGSLVLVAGGDGDDVGFAGRMVAGAVAAMAPALAGDLAATAIRVNAVTGGGADAIAAAAAWLADAGAAPLNGVAITL